MAGPRESRLNQAPGVWERDGVGFRRGPGGLGGLGWAGRSLIVCGLIGPQWGVRGIQRSLAG